RFLEWAARDWPGWAHQGALAVSLAISLAGLSVALANRPISSREDGAPMKQKEFLYLILLPILLSAMLLIVFSVRQPRPNLGFDPMLVLYAAIAGIVSYATALIGVLIVRALTGKPMPSRRLAWWPLTGAVAGIMIGYLGEWFRTEEAYRLIESFDGGDQMHPYGLKVLTVLGMAWIMMSFLTADLIFVGLTSYASKGDPDREWSARASGWLAASSLVWLLVAGTTRFGPAAFGALGKFLVVTAG